MTSARTSLWRDRRGVSAIEFALIGPLFVLLVALLLEAGLLWSGKLTLEAGARAASRYGLTGAEVAGRTRSEVLRRIITEHVCPSALAGSSLQRCYWAPGGPLSTDENGAATPLFFDLKAYRDPRNIGRGEPFADAVFVNGTHDAGEPFDDINGNGVWDADTGRAGPGGAGDVVIYRAAIYQKLINPLVREALGSDFVRHETRIVIRNEPF